MKINKKFCDKLSFILIIIFFYQIHSYDIASLKIIYFTKNNQLNFINGINNKEGDLYLEFWGDNTKMRYFICLRSNTGKKIYFDENEILHVESSQISEYQHESVIIDYNGTDNIFSMNYQYFDFIDINGKRITSDTTNNKLSQGTNNFRMRIFIKLSNLHQTKLVDFTF